MLCWYGVGVGYMLGACMNDTFRCRLMLIAVSFSIHFKKNAQKDLATNLPTSRETID